MIDFCEKKLTLTKAVPFRFMQTVCLSALLSLLILLPATPANAQLQKGFDRVKTAATLAGVGETDLTKFVTGILNTFLGLAGLIAAIFIIYGGVKYITSRGDEKATAAAKQTILYAVIGLIVIGLSAALVNFVVGAITGQSSAPMPSP